MTKRIRRSTPPLDKIKRVRQRQRADGTWRIWWEPETSIRPMGFQVIELDERRLTWSRAEAERLNADVDRARVTGSAPVRSTSARTMHALIDEYEQSRQLRDLAPKTQQSYGKLLRIIRGKWGSDLVADFTEAVIDQWYETNYRIRGDYQALALHRQLSILFNYAERPLGWRQRLSNPCARANVKVPKGRRRNGTADELAALFAAATSLSLPAMRLAIGLGVYTGQRQTDIIQASPAEFQMLRYLDGDALSSRMCWTITRSKRGTTGAIPIHADLLLQLQDQIDQVGADSDYLLRDEATGNPYSEDLFQHRWQKIRRTAAIKRPSVASLQFRDLRRTFGHLARAGGASRDDTADVLGNSSAVNDQLAEVYMAGQITTTARAVDAVQLTTKGKTKK